MDIYGAIQSTSVSRACAGGLISVIRRKNAVLRVQHVENPGWPKNQRGFFMPISFMLNKGKVPVKIFTDDVDSASLTQLGNLSQLPFIHSHIAAMPDVHHGIGATVGSVFQRGAIIPLPSGWILVVDERGAFIAQSPRLAR